MAELAQQGANGSFSTSQRSALNKELSALTSELSRIRATVTFNGQSLLRGGAVNGTAKTLDTGNSTNVQASSDGRYITYLKSGTLYQQDTTTGTTSTIASSVSVMAATSRGDYITYNSGTTVMLYDRLAGTSQSLGNAQHLDSLAISDDGSRVAFIGRFQFSSNGTSLGLAGGGLRNITMINTATGQFNGDSGGNGFSLGFSSLTLSSDGTRVGLINAAGSVYNSATSTLAAGLIGGIYVGFTATKIAFDSGNSLVFSSTSNVGSLNSSGVANVYRLLNETSFSAITSLTSGAGISNFFMTDNRNTVTFATTANLLSQNPSAQTQLYKSDFSGNLSQLTSFAANEATNLTAVSGDGYTLYTSSSSLLQSREIPGEMNIVIDTGDGLAGLITGQIRDFEAAARGSAFLDVSTQRNARLALEVINSNVERLGLAQGILGGNLARLETAYRSTKSETVELTAAKSRIQDVDIAAGFAEQTRLSILGNVQAGLLAGASRLVPEIALDLLRSAGTK